MHCPRRHSKRQRCFLLWSLLLLTCGSFFLLSVGVSGSLSTSADPQTRALLAPYEEREACAPSFLTGWWRAQSGWWTQHSYPEALSSQEWSCGVPAWPLVLLPASSPSSLPPAQLKEHPSAWGGGWGHVGESQVKFLTGNKSHFPESLDKMRH